ncbi:MAG: hypothetical protein JNM18_16530 [Planctomycetaceae bacterium]|nr:hypothetical protein [Planctomycetaceae bacterium]
MSNSCELCGRDKPLTKHHLIPRAVHGKTRFRRRYTKVEMHTRSIRICRLCHNGIHDLIPDEKLLAEHFNTLAALLTHEGLQRHIAWVRKQK